MKNILIVDFQNMSINKLCPFLSWFIQMCEVLLCLFYIGFQYFVIFIDDYSHCTCLFLMKSRSESYFIFESFCDEIKTLFKLLFVCCKVITLVNIFLLPLLNSYLPTKSFINPLVLIPHNKMGLLSVRINISLKLPTFYFCIIKSLFSFGYTLC